MYKPLAVDRTLGVEGAAASVEAGDERGAPGSARATPFRRSTVRRGWRPALGGLLVVAALAAAARMYAKGTLAGAAVSDQIGASSVACKLVQFEQCGGLNFDGDGCCIAGCTCDGKDESYKQCTPIDSGDGKCNVEAAEAAADKVMKEALPLQAAAVKSIEREAAAAKAEAKLAERAAKVLGVTATVAAKQAAPVKAAYEQAKKGEGVKWTQEVAKGEAVHPFSIKAGKAAAKVVAEVSAAEKMRTKAASETGELLSKIKKMANKVAKYTGAASAGD
mmetsp:Transcript_76401/g.216024  ORF Transcript_76401/g.216024 Transcript_76401/m.216024 type:complete len:277 (-) Transcript_76401:146-976(-)